MGFLTRIASLLAISASLAIAAGCSGHGSQIPAAPVADMSSQISASSGTGISHQSVSPLSMLSNLFYHPWLVKRPATHITTQLATGACGTKLLFMSDTFNSKIYIYSGTSLCATITSLVTPLGMDVDSTGNLWVANYQGNDVLEYKPPYTSPAKLINDAGNLPTGVAVCKGYIAITNQETLSGTAGDVQILRNGKLTELHDPNVFKEFFPVCDPNGDLFTDGQDSGGHTVVNEWKLGAGKAIELPAVARATAFPGGLDWEGTSLFVDDQGLLKVTEWKAPFATPSGTIHLKNAGDPGTIKVDASDKLIATGDADFDEGIVYSMTGTPIYKLAPGQSGGLVGGVTWNKDDQ